MAFSEICRICLSVNVRVIVLKKTGLRNLYKTLTNSFMNEDEDEGPIIVCFICHARLNRCRRLQQQAIESNAVLEQLLAGGSMSIPKSHEARDEIQFTPISHIDIWPEECDTENDCKDEIFILDSVKVEEENFENENIKFEENGNYEREQYITPTNNFSEPSEKKVISNSTDSNINDVHKEYLDFESPSIESNPKVKKDNQPINKKGKHLAKIMKKKFLKQKGVNILTEKTSGAATKYIFHCDVCSKKFLTKDILANHISYSHKTQKNSDTTGEKPFSCNICEYKFIKKSKLQRHMKTHTGEKPHSCNVCLYKCIQKSSLQRHMKTHTGEKHFSCNICEYKCITKSNLQKHMKTHSREKPPSCNICEYKCITKSKMQAHMKIHTGEKPFSCNICEYKCIQKSNLRRHMRIHSREKPFSCNICEYKSIIKSSLQNHMIKHTGKKSFSCNICEYKCILKSNLQTHMKIHTGEKPFSCNICEYKCIQKSNLRRHMKTHTGEKPFV